ncbi:hypothetical protein [Saliphagus sp. LR7]|uniref:hypothetical protein n=1 Tax=Saliphagus sp. LR7 TaxID=2282654 RepID=UPI000DF7F855|nr:hypothetical protein [Saliphagus sp. LR7]
MGRGNSPDQADVVTRRDFFFTTGCIVVLSGATGCLGTGNNAQQAEEPESETGENNSEDESENESGSPILEEERGDENEFEDEAVVEEGDDDNDVAAGGNGSIGEEEPDDEATEDEREADDASEGPGREKDDEGRTTNSDSEDKTSDIDGENGITDESHDNETTEEPQDQDDSGDETGENRSEDSTGEGDSESDQEEEDSGGEEGGEVGRFERYRIEELTYQVDYPADWAIDEGDDYVKIHNDDETAWLWIEIWEARSNLDREVRHFREDFEPDPSVEIHADDPVTLSSGEEGHRFIIEMAERERNFFAHELIAQASGYQYRTAVVVSRSVYNEEYAQLAEEILATVALR